MSRTDQLGRNAGARLWRTAVTGVLVAGGAAAYADQPEIVYERVFSQFGFIQPHDIVADDDGSAYVLAARPGSNYATLVLKLDADGNIVWSQWFDGSHHDIPGGITIDAAGDVYVVGTTGSDDFPTLNPLQAAPSSVQYEAFVMRLSGVDGAPLYSTYLGASRSEWGYDIAVNDAGEMYVVGSTKSLDFPVVNPIQDQLSGYPYFGWEDAYIAKISADGSQLLYSTFFGGYVDDAARGIALDAAGRMYIVGETGSDDFPTVGPVQASNGGGKDAFAARISADGSTVEYSTYLGGEESESVRGIALDADGRLYFDGHTQSVSFPTTSGAYQEDFVGAILGCEVPFGADYDCDDVFVASLMPDGASLDYATYLGGHQIDQGHGLAVDSSGRAYASGHTRSDDFPPYAGGTFYTNFVTKLDESGSNLIYSFLHETATPSPAYVALDAAGDIYVAGTVGTPTDLFVAKLRESAALSGDLDGDGDVDLDDFGAFAACYNGAKNPPAPGCPAGVDADLDGDGDVDLDDFSIFAANYTGSL